MSQETELLDQFLSYLHLDTGLSRHSIKAYQTDIGQFILFNRNHGRSLLVVKPEQAVEFIQHLSHRWLNPSTKARKISALRHFYHYLQINDHNKENPFNQIVMPKQSVSVPKPLTEEQVEREKDYG